MYSFALIIAVLYILQTTLAPHMAVFGIVPDLIMSALIAFTIIEGRERGVKAGIITGIAIDLLTAAHFGMYTLTYLYITAAAGSLSMKMIGKNAVTSAAVTFAAGLMLGAVAAVVVYVLKIDRNILYNLLTAPLLGLYNAVFGFVLYFLFDAAAQLSYRRRF